MKLSDLQKHLKQKNLPAYLLTRNNMFWGEDVLPSENKIMELSGFTGSAATMLITPQNAWLLVDGRYSIQAQNETDASQITVVDSTDGLNDVLNLCKQNNIDKLAYNPWCLPVSAVNFIKRASLLTLIAEPDLICGILSDEPVNVFIHDVKYCGKTAEEKCHEVANAFSDSADAMLICNPAQVSWLLNLRSHTLPDTPILRAFALLHRNGKAFAYADSCNFNGIKQMADLFADLQLLSGKKLAIDLHTTPQYIFDKLHNIKTVQLQSNPLLELKLNKNPTELEGFRNAHIRDGIAVTKFLYWLEQNRHGLHELDVVEKLKQFRQKQNLFFSDSFGTIAASAANAAIVHYQPNGTHNAQLNNNSVLLLDSGAQYFDGTTDVTRTIALGTPPEEIKTAFTEVLKAHIALASAVFPANTPASALDAVCRLPLWKSGKDYRHGTGHSVGHFSDVHESPFGLSPRCHMPIKENYITSIEPGVYFEGKFGIRIENLAYAAKAEYEGFLQFKNLTLIPIDKRLINPYMLSVGEQSWLNSYHRQVLSCLAPYMNAAEKEWLCKACSPL